MFNILRMVGFDQSAPAAANKELVVVAPRYVLPKPPPHLARFKKIAVEPAHTQLVSNYEAARKDKAVKGQEKLDAGAELKALQKTAMPIQKRIAALSRQRAEVARKVAACETINEKYPAEVCALAVRNKALCESEQLIKTEMGFDRLLKDESQCESRKFKLQSEKRLLEKNRDAVQDRIQGLEKKIDQTNRSLKDLPAQQDDIKRQRAEIEAQREALAGIEKTLATELSAMEEKQQNLTSRQSYLVGKLNSHEKTEPDNKNSGSRRAPARHDDSRKPESRHRSHRDRELVEVRASLAGLENEIAAIEIKLQENVDQSADLKKKDDRLKRKLLSGRRETADGEDDLDSWKRDLKKERKALENIQKSLAPLYDSLAQVCEEIETIERHFESLNTGPLHEVNSGLASVKEQYKEFSISRKAQLELRKTLETLDRHQVQADRLDKAIGVQSRKLDALEKKEDIKILEIDGISARMDTIQQSLREISQDMRCQLDERASMAARRGIAGTTAGKAGNDNTRQTNAAQDRDRENRLYRFFGDTNSGLLQAIMGVDALAQTLPVIHERIRSLHSGQTRLSMTRNGMTHTFMAFGPNQQTGRKGNLPDGTAFSVPANSPYVYLYETERKRTQPEAPGARPQDFSSESEEIESEEDTFVPLPPKLPRSVPTPAERMPQPGTRAKAPPAPHMPRSGNGKGSAMNPDGQDRFPHRESPFHPAAGRVHPEASENKQGKQRQAQRPYPSPRSGPSMGSSRRTTQAPRNFNSWESGYRLLPQNHLAGLELFGGLDEDCIPLEVLRHFEDFPANRSCVIPAYPGFSARPHSKGDLPGRYLIVRANQPSAFIVRDHPRQIRFPSGSEFYFVTELPFIIDVEPGRTGTRAGYTHAEESRDDSDTTLPREKPRYAHAMPRTNSGFSYRRERAPSPLRDSRKAHFRSDRGAPHGPPRDEYARQQESHSTGRSRFPSARQEFPFENPFTQSAENDFDEEFDDAFRAHFREQTRRGKPRGTNPQPRPEQTAPATPAEPAEKTFIERRVKPLPFKSGEKIDLTDFMERRMNPEELLERIVKPLKAGLADSQIQDLVKSLDLLLSFSKNDVQKIPGAGKLFEQFAGEEKTKMSLLRGEQDLNATQRETVREAIKKNLREKQMEVIKANESALLARRFPGSDDDTERKRLNMINELVVELTNFFEIEDGGSNGREKKDGNGRPERHLTGTRREELRKLIDQASRDPRSVQSEQEKSEIAASKIRNWNSLATDVVDDQALAFGRFYLDHYYKNVFNAGLSSIADNPSVRINILKLRSKLRE